MSSATGKKTTWQRIARRIRVPLGFAFAALYLWRANPSRTTLLWSLLLVLPGLWLRAYASGYVKKNSELAVTGPYAYTRNPLYLGSMLMAFGFAAASRRWEILVIFAALFFAIYLPTIFSEEEFLRGAFPAFADYAARVPRLLPRLMPARAPQAESGAFSGALYLRHREYNALMGVAALYAALALRMIYITR
ncbi:MAG TPA: isoprenylcysteine carboxylmethyltransferase family protein [Acidobacteriaceae bacterium]